ncbi:MAG TPA: glycogen synthase [Actinomycetota bacterium]|nr:glycogen synthase [Actinomycetota bacterium]
MKVALMTREYPPEVYGGAGVHVAHLAAELARHIAVEVRCFGQPREPGPPGSPEVRAFGVPNAGPDAPENLATLETVMVNLAMAAGLGGVDILHSHTWYANLGGHAGKLLNGIPHVMTSHSLEPKRTWKAEQLGAGGYALSSFCERTAIESADAVIAVSAQMRRDILECYPMVAPETVRVIHNGVNASEYRPDPGTAILEAHGIDPAQPSVVFVGRITRQKGITHLLDAAAELDPAAQLVLCASAPDTPAIAAETEAKVADLQAQRPGVIWLSDVLESAAIIQVLSHATVFCCPSIYEPLGIVNLEAMACEVPVVATATGGIPEVVEDGVTGLLVPYRPAADGQGPEDPVAFAKELAHRINEVLADPARAAEMGRAGRRRVIEHFTWKVAGRKTIALYESLIG